MACENSRLGCTRSISKFSFLVGKFDIEEWGREKINQGQGGHGQDQVLGYIKEVRNQVHGWKGQYKGNGKAMARKY